MTNGEIAEVTQVIDVCTLAPLARHSFIFQAFDPLQSGESLVLINDHDPMPLYYQFSKKRADGFMWEYLEQGPDVWRVRISKL